MIPSLDYDVVRGQISKLWSGVVAASHYDSPPLETWAYADTRWFGGVLGAVSRANRMAKIPKLLLGECDLAIQSLA